MAIDSHTHLTDKKFDIDRQDVIKRAFKGGLSKLFEVACEPNDWDGALEIAKQDNIFAVLGIHPCEVQNTNQQDLAKLEKLIEQEKCVAIGEAGLDYHYDTTYKSFQKEIFIKHLDMAVKHNKPIVIHCREANDDMIEILKNYPKKLPTGIIHSFEGTAQEAQIFIDMGFYIGVCATITYPKSDIMREVVSKIDISKLLIETDCPYRAPQKFRGQRCEPLYVLEVLNKLAEIKGIDVKVADEITTQNTLRLFGR